MMRPLALLLHVLCPLAIWLAALSPQTALAQPAPGYIGPNLDSEPRLQQRGKAGRWGGDYGDWQFCAREGDRCEVRGWGVVRYGARGRYVYREVNSARFDCDNRMFGDPARGDRKVCEFRLAHYDDGYPGGGWDDAGWERCAREGETCYVRDRRATVRYGVDGRYYERSVRGGSIDCDNGTFGDPAPGRRKHCDVRVGGGGRPGVPGIGDGWDGGDWGGSGWIPCASEGRSCVLPGPASVRYGADGRYTVKHFSGGTVYCGNNVFGDPARGEKKSCDYRVDGWQGGGWNDRPGDWNGRWVYCAREDDYCDFRGRREVRYAAEDGREVVRSFRNGVECSNRAFGHDPAPGRKKACYLAD